MQQESGKDVRVFVVWEPVLFTDLMAPSTATLKRISDTRALQYWDRGRLLSKAMGETSRKSVVWDRVMVYPRGAVWSEAAPPEPLIMVGPVVEELPAFSASLQHALDGTR